jgi:hypothetical protein
MKPPFKALLLVPALLCTPGAGASVVDGADASSRFFRIADGPDPFPVGGLQLLPAADHNLRFAATAAAWGGGANPASAPADPVIVAGVLAGEGFLNALIAELAGAAAALFGGADADDETALPESFGATLDNWFTGSALDGGEGLLPNGDGLAAKPDLRVTLTVFEAPATRSPALLAFLSLSGSAFGAPWRVSHGCWPGSSCGWFVGGNPQPAFAAGLSGERWVTAVPEPASAVLWLAGCWVLLRAGLLQTRGPTAKPRTSAIAPPPPRR